MSVILIQPVSYLYRATLTRDEAINLLVDVSVPQDVRARLSTFTDEELGTLIAEQANGDDPANVYETLVNAAGEYDSDSADPGDWTVGR